MSGFITTFTPYFKKSVMRELQKVDKHIKAELSVSDSVMLFSSSFEGYSFLKKLSESKPIFIKHICPADKAMKLSGELEQDRKDILEKLLKNDVKIEKGEKYSVQTRIFKANAEYSAKDIEVFVGSHFEKLGGIPVFSKNKLTSDVNVKIISISIYKNDLYLGLSQASDNLNFDCDQYRILSHGGREVSRAENKLKEAIAKYGLSGKGKALDIGAAPGGWSKVLLDAGYEVVAVDPGKLNEELLKNPKLRHYKCRIEELSFDGEFNIITNDMNVEPKVTGEIMNGLAHCLKDGGMAVVTLKLPGNPEKGVDEGVKELSKNYEVLFVNSLFHNRREVTALLRKNISK